VHFNCVFKRLKPFTGLDRLGNLNDEQLNPISDVAL